MKLELIYIYWEDQLSDFISTFHFQRLTNTIISLNLRTIAAFLQNHQSQTIF